LGLQKWKGGYWSIGRLRGLGINTWQETSYLLVVVLTPLFRCAGVAVSSGLLHLLDLLTVLDRGRDEKHADLTIAPSSFP